MNLTIPKSDLNIVRVAAVILVTEEVKGDLSLLIETNKCSLDMKTCEKFTGVNVPDICKKFVDKNAFYSPVFEKIKPPFRCPLKPGLYTLEESVLDLFIISMMPLDGYIWVVKFQLISSQKGKKAKEIAMCLNSETKITRARRP